MGYTPPYLEVRKVTGGWAIYPPSRTSTEDLFIYANQIDTGPYIRLDGTGDAFIQVPTGQGFSWIESGTTKFRLTETTPDLILESNVDANNIFLKTTGAGVVKFGTYTAGAATDSTGYITILDALGNTRKLMVQA